MAWERPGALRAWKHVSLLGIALACGATARADPSGYLYGYVLDPSLAGVAGASVSVVDEASGFHRAAQSRADGGYIVAPLAPGSYKVTVRKDGFRTMIRFHVRAEPSGPTRADWALSLGSMQETITVAATPLPIPREDASVATILERDDIENLPLNGRGLLGLMELAPGTTIVPATRGDAGQFVTAGQRANANYFTVDGISANNSISAGGLPAQVTAGTLPVMSALGSLDSLAPLDAVQEVRIQTSTSPSDFGRLPGAAIAISSRSGSDEFHGSAAYSFRNEFLSANDWFANRAGEPRAPLREQNGAATLGGPLRRNQTFVFLSYERMSFEQPFAWFEPVPSLEARNSAAAWVQPLLDLFPDPNGIGLGNGLAVWNGRDSRPAGMESGSIRADQLLAHGISLFGRYSDAPSHNEFGSTQVDRLDFRSWSGTLGLHLRSGPDAAIDFRINQSVTAASSMWSGNSGCELLPIVEQFQPSNPTCDLLLRFQIGGVGQLLSGSEGGRRQSQFQFVQATSWKRGPHALRFGVDFRRIVPVRRDAYGTLSLIADSIPALNNTGNYWIASTAPQVGSTQVRELSLWAHDTWQVLPRLSLAAGVRWEYSPAPTLPGAVNFFDPETVTVEPENRPLWWKPYGHFAPRAGIVFNPGKSGRTVLRAGAGLYFDSSLSIATDVISDGPLSVGLYGGGRFAPFPAYLLFGFMPNLTLPRVVQWNFSLEHTLSSHDVVSLGYVGSAGRELIRREAGGPGSQPIFWAALTTNNGRSDYNALMAQYRRRVADGLEALVSYSWSHSLDNDSSDAFLLWAGAGSSPARDRASSDFDLRHSLTASFHYTLPGRAKSWSIDGLFRAQTGFPLTILDADEYVGISFMNAFRPDLVPGVPAWIADPSVPGGRRLNPQAFQPAQAVQQGNLGRNALSGFGMSQFDLAVHRQFRLADRRILEFRVDAFNALNHANFADPIRYLNDPLFGQSTSMRNLMLGTGSSASGLTPLLEAGGPRSVEATVRLRF